MSMRWVVYSGWLMIALGAAMLAGAIAAGEPLYGAGMLVALAGPGALMVHWGSGWDKPLESAEDLYQWGRPANATVLEVSEPTLDGRGLRTAKLRLRVTPRNESAFKTTRTVALPHGRIPTAGETVTVKFDPNRRRDFVLLEESYEVRDQVQLASDSLGQARELLGGFQAPKE